MKIKFVGFIAALLLAVAVVFVLTRSSDQPDPDEVSATQLDIGYSRLRISLPVFVAEELGYFDENGIDANLLMYETAQPLMQALVQGQIDVAGYTALPITYNGMIRSDRELYFASLMIEDQEHRISYLLRPTADASINSISDLKGRTIGILPTIAYRSWLEAMLEAEGIDPESDVIIQQVAPTLQAQALSSGGVDALFTNDPSATSAIQIGVAEVVSDTVFVPTYLGEPFPFGSFNLSKEWADNNPEAAAAVVRSIDKAIDYINQNPAEAKQLMAKYLPDQFQPHVQFYPNAKYTLSSDTTEDVLSATADQYLEIGIINEAMQFDGLVYRVQSE